MPEETGEMRVCLRKERIETRLAPLPVRRKAIIREELAAMDCHRTHKPSDNLQVSLLAPTHIYIHICIMSKYSTSTAVVAVANA